MTNKKPSNDAMKNRINNMFSGQDLPSYSSLREVETLKSRIAELEKELAAQQVEKELIAKQIETEQAISISETDTTAETTPALLPQKSLISFEESGSGDTRQKQIAMWAAGIFSAVGLAFLCYGIYMVAIVQQGRFDLSDKVLLPLSAIMLLTNLFAYTLIRRGAQSLGIGLTFFIGVLLPPILGVLVLKDFGATSVLYTALLSFLMISLVIPRTSRVWAVIATTVTILIVVGIESLNPGFRVETGINEDINIIAGIAALGLIAFTVRQVTAGSINTKLVTAFVVVAILSMGVVAYQADRSLRNSLTSEIVDNQVFLATSQSLQIGQAINSQYDKLKGLATIRTIQTDTEAANQDESRPTDVAEIENLNLAWREIAKVKNTADPLAIKILYNPLSTQLRKFQNTFPENTEILLTDDKGFSIASTNFPANYYQADTLWWRTAHTTGQYIGQPILDPATNSVALDMAIPIYSYINGEFVGVLRTIVNFNVLSDLLIEGLHGQTGYSIIYLPNDQQIRLQLTDNGTYAIAQAFASTDLQNYVRSSISSTEFTLDGTPVLASSAPVKSYSSTLPGQATSALDSLGWRVVVIQEKSEALQPVTTQTRNNLILFAFIIILVIAASYFLAGFITNPIVRLTAVANQLASGNLTAEAKVETRDEIGTLATTFNRMTSQLRETLFGLEGRVADRTHDLELASEVGQAITEKMANLSGLLSDAAETIRSRFDLYYTQIYLIDPTRRTLNLRAGTGEAGKELLRRGHHLEISSTSLNARAVSEKRAIFVDDTKDNPNFLPNPLLPLTRSELAIPLIASGKVVGVLDMQSERSETFNKENFPAFQVLAGQLAIAIQNASLFEQAEQARMEVEDRAKQQAYANWLNFLNAIDRDEKVGYIYRQNEVTPISNSIQELDQRSALHTPIMVAGTEVGDIHIADDPNRKWTSTDAAIINETAAQLSRHIENLRLLAQSDKYRQEAEEVSKRLTREGWADYLANRKELAEGFVYEGNKVQPLITTENHNNNGAHSYPIYIREEYIGDLAVDMQGADAEDTNEIASAVIQQLSSHIENLRLLEETQEQRGQLSEALNIAKLANWEFDVERGIFTFNDNFYQIFHTTAEREGGYEISAEKYAGRFVHPDDLAVVGVEIEKALNSKGRTYNTSLEHRILYADGGIGYISVNINVERDENGKIQRYYGANQDITERKQAEMELLRLARAVDSTADMVVITDTKGVIQFANPAFEKVTGYKISEAIGGNPRLLKSGVQDAEFYKDMWGTILSKKVWSGELTNRRKDGTFYEAQLTISPITNERGEIDQFVAVQRDITERKHAEQTIARRATELATVAEVSTTVSTLLNPDKLLQSVVDLTKDRFGLYHAHIYLVDESLNTLLLTAGAGETGRRMAAVGHSIPMETEKSLVARATRERKAVIVNDVHNEEGFLPNPMLPETRAEMAIPMIVGDQVIGVFDVQSEVENRFTQEDASIFTTLASQAAIALQNARSYMEQAATVTQLRELDRLKSSFLANMSHELRTPLNSILGFTDVMLEELDGPLTPNMDNDLKLIQKNGKHLLHLINDVLDMAKIESGKMNLIVEKFNLNETIEDVMSITSSLANEKSLALFMDPESDQNVFIRADHTRLRQVLINVVNNGIKFTEKGSVSVLVKHRGNDVLIAVKDTGLGIPKDHLDSVFQEFTQVDSSTTRKAGGTGLGLPISRRLIEMHGGKLWAESSGQNGGGSTFNILLPVEAVVSEATASEAFEKK